MATTALRATRFALVLFAVVGLVTTVVPVVPMDVWWIRYLDYPRLQFTLVKLVALVAAAVLPGRTRTTWWVATCLVVAIGWNAVLLGPYVLPLIGPIHAPQVEAAGECPAERRLRVLSVNVQMSSHHDHHLLEIVRKADPDIVWFQETEARTVGAG